jgi:hypothetical protein
MDRTITISLVIAGLMCSHIGYAAVKTAKAKSTKKQKRLKINPVTDEGDAWTANAETAIYRAGTFENLSVGYSTSNGWDLSLSLVNIEIIGPNKLFQGDTFINIAKTFPIYPDFSIVVGSQNGVALFNSHPQLWFNYNYLDGRYDVTPWLSMHLGSYLANSALTGTARQVGLTVGTEIGIIPHKLALQMDYTSGHQAVSGAAVNMLWTVTSRCQMYMGVYVPEQNSGNEFAGIIGFNLSSKNF